MKTLLEKIRSIPIGYSQAFYKKKKYGVSRSDFNNGNSIKLYAEELGGTDIISLNYYITLKHDFLKPCEMSSQKVIDFIENHKKIQHEKL